MMVSIIEVFLYTKPKAEHQYLLRSSCHPLHTERAFPFSLALRVRPMCSSSETYNLGLLNQEIQRVHIITHTHPSVSPTCIPLVIGYPPAIRSISSIFQSTFTFSHPHNFVLLGLNIYLSLPSHVRTSRKFANWTSRLEPELSIMHCSIWPVTTPPPPGQPPGQVQPFGPRGGELFEAVLSRG